MTLALGCKVGTVTEPPTADNGKQSCLADSSQSPESAFAGTLATELTDTICPRRDDDYWRFKLTAGQIAAVEFRYEKLANVQLAAEWIGPEGACVPTTSTSCTEESGCTNNLVCDTTRGVCRRSAANEPCVTDAHCPAGERCLIVPASISYATEPQLSAATHLLRTTFPVALAGDYVLRVFDKLASLADPEVKYSLRVEVTTEPDKYEPNDAPGMATPLTSGTAVDALLSHRGRGDGGDAQHQSDIDWYVITPTAGTRPVVAVELYWPESATIAPTWIISQGTWTKASARARLVGSGNDALNVRGDSFVAASDAPIYLQVSNTQPTTDMTNGYKLMVTLAIEASESGGRNDSPNTAIPAVLGTATSANPPSYSFQGTIGASDDKDWYRLDTPASSENSLAYIRVTPSAPTDAYLLMLETFRRSTTTCTTDAECGVSGFCVASACVMPWVQRPSPDGKGDPQRGGLSPNRIETQLPLFEHGQGSLYIVVRNLSSTMLDIPGYSLTATYDLRVEHRYEPDDTDRAADATRPDNNFVVLPLAAATTSAAFYRHAREVSGSDYTLVAPGTGGEPFVALAPNTTATIGTCGPVTIHAFDAVGTPMASGTVDVTAGGGGDIVDDCAALPPTPIAAPVVTIASGTGTFNYRAPAAGANDFSATLGATVSGGSPQTLAMSVLALPGNAITFAGKSGGTLPRTFPAQATSPVVRITLPDAVSSARRLSLTATNATVACVLFNEDSTTHVRTCQNITGLTNPCPAELSGAGAKSSCQVLIPTGSAAIDVELLASGPGLVTLRADDDVTQQVGSSTYVASATTPASLVTNTTTWIRGYISYEGDNDYFTIPLAAFPKAGMTVRLKMGATPVDIRMNATRGTTGNYGGGLAVVVADEAHPNADQCIDYQCERGTCDLRGQCTQPAYSGEVGVDAVTPRCLYLDQLATELVVRVNDVDANDWDTTVPYEFQLSLDEGCPSICDPRLCAQQ